MKKLMFCVLAVVLAAGLALAGEDKEKDKDKDKEDAVKNYLKLSKDELKEEFEAAGDFATKIQIAFAMKKKKLKEGKKFLIEAFNSGFSDFSGDASGRLPYSRREDKEYKVESFEDLLLDIKACFALLEEIKNKRKKIEELKEKVRRSQNQMAMAQNKNDTRAAEQASRQAQQYEKEVKKCEGEITVIQNKFKNVGCYRIKKAGKSKDKMISGFSKYALKVLLSFFKST
jgi:type III secretory pathway component EscV